MAVIGIFIVLMALLAAAIALGAIVVPIFAVVLIVSCCLFFFVFWIWMLVHSIKNENLSGNERVVWVVVIGLTHWLGALIYFFAARTRQKSLTTAPPLARA